MSDILITDTECYHDLWCIGFQRFPDGKTLVLRKTAIEELDRDRLRRLVTRNTIVTYNGLGYDRAMIWGAIEGLSLADLKAMSDDIINQHIKWWDQDRLLMRNYVPQWDGFPKMDLIDLMEPQPNPFAGLKLLNGRLHGKKMQDLPYAPDHRLMPDEIEHVVSYMGNDLDATRLVFESLAEPLALRAAMSDDLSTPDYRIDFRSKSDSQMGESIVKKRYEQITKKRIGHAKAESGWTFKFKPLPCIKFETPQLQEVLDKLMAAEFRVKPNYKVDMPAFLSDLKIDIGGTTYAMGIGGLHSTEANRSIFADDQTELIDADVASQYPSIILLLMSVMGLYPKALGPAAHTAYAAIKEERLTAKARVKEIQKKDLEDLRSWPATTELEKDKAKKRYLALQSELATMKAKDQGLKIALNGGFFGKTGSPYSALFAPDLMIAVTLTGQLTLLMLIERAHAAGIPIVSGNTDGVLFYCAKDRHEDLMLLCKQWEAETSLELEFARYRSIHNQSVNTYIAVKEDGSLKRKGTLMNTRKEGLREQMMHNPGMDICSDAVCEFLLHGTPVEETIYRATDVRDFLTVTNVKGGATWRGEYLGKVVRYYWGIGGEPILYKEPHATTGNFKKVSKSDGAIPCMDMPDGIPVDVDYDRYIAAAEEIMIDLALKPKPLVLKPVAWRRLLKTTLVL